MFFSCVNRTFVYFLIFFVCIQAVFAGDGLDTYSSPDYMRTLNRSASIGSIDSLLFNPSGALRLAKGVYLQLGGELPFQFLSFDDLKNPKTPTPIEGSTTNVGLILPSVSFFRKWEKIGTFFTFAPVYNSSVAINRIVTRLGSPQLGDVRFGGKREAAGPFVASYDIKNFMYEFVGGVAWPVFRDDLLLSVAGVIMFDTELCEMTYYKNSIEEHFMEKFDLFGFLVGTAVQASLTYNPVSLDWFSVSLNVHTGGFAPSAHFSKTKFSPDGIITLANGKKTIPSSLEERPPVGGFYVVKYLPMRISLGTSFDILGKAVLQITSNFEASIRNSTVPIIEATSKFFYHSYGFGAGLDYTVSKHLVWGLGLFYKNGSEKDAIYESPVDTIKSLKYQSISFGSGLVISLRDVVDINISATYPLYFRTVVENLGNPDENREIQVVKFRVFGVDSPGPLGPDPFISIKDFSLGIGMVFKF